MSMEHEPLFPDIQTDSPQSAAPAALTQSPAVQTSTPDHKRTLVIAGLVIGIGLLVLLLFSLMRSKPPPPGPVAPASPTPSPTPIRILSVIATDSAFQALRASQASLSSELSLLSPDDPSLTPPVLVLPLGFKP